MENTNEQESDEEFELEDSEEQREIEKLENIIKETDIPNYPRSISQQIIPILESEESPQQINLETELENVPSPKSSEEKPIYESGVKYEGGEKEYDASNPTNTLEPPIMHPTITQEPQFSSSRTNQTILREPSDLQTWGPSLEKEAEKYKTIDTGTKKKDVMF